MSTTVIEDQIRMYAKLLKIPTCKLRLNGIPVPPKRNGYSIFIGTNIIHPCYSVSLILIPFISKRYV